MVSGLMNVAAELATAVATGLGIREMPAPMPRAMTRTITPEVSASSALSLFARPGDRTIRARRVAVLVADGCDAGPLLALTDRLTAEGAVPRFVSTRLGPVEPSAGETIEVDVSLEAAPSVLYDAVVVPGGESAIKILQQDGRTLEFLKDQYRHCKPLLALTGADTSAAGLRDQPDAPDRRARSWRHHRRDGRGRHLRPVRRGDRQATAISSARPILRAYESPCRRDRRERFTQ